MVEQGKDIAELFSGTEVKDFTLTHGGKEWTFKYRPISWQDHFQAVEVGWETTLDPQGKSEMFFNAAKYYENLFVLAIVAGPSGQAPSRMELRALHPDVIGQLTSIVPSPKLTRELAESKKDLETSSTEESIVSVSGSEPE